MVTKSFYLLGRDPAVHANVHLVEIDITHNLDAAKSYVADSFSILDPKGVGFKTTAGADLPELDDILDEDGDIAVTIDGNPVREVPGPKGLPMVGSFYETYPDHLGNHHRMFAQYGHVIQHTNMGRTQYLTDDPMVTIHVLQETPFWSKLITDDHPLAPAKNNEDGLFLADTDTRAWKLAHKFLPPALAPKAVRKYTPMLQRATEETFNVFDGFSANNEAFDVFSYMFKLTSHAVAKVTLDLDMHHFDTPDTPVHPLVSELLRMTTLLKTVGERGTWYSHLPFGAPKELRETKASFERHCKEAIQKAQERGGEDLPIATAAIEAESIADFAVRAVDEDGNKLPMDVMLHALPVIIGAGFVTTATLLSWMIYCVSHYPGVQDRLVQELIDHGVTNETQWNYDTTNDLPYLDKFMKEVQRLYNPAFQPARTALREQIIPGGYHIPKGAIMVSALHAVHRNPEFWDDPTKFDPDRWDTEKVKKRPAGAYIPFAMGPRSCPGFNFALQEAKTVFATLLYRYTFIEHDHDKVAYDPGALVYKPSDLYMQIQRRTDWPQASQESAKSAK